MTLRLLAVLIVTLVCTSAAEARARPVVVLGIDGMDPQLLERFVERGIMPNFADLMQDGTFMPLGTSVPPQSPVAWSNFITGMDPGGHGVFDFIHRDTTTYLPVFSTARVIQPEKTFTLGDWVIPLSSGRTELLRKGEAFWQVLDRHDVPYTILRVPANFPPAHGSGRTLAGMGTPDLAGTYGTFTYITNDPAFPSSDVPGGRLEFVDVRNGHARAELRGPENTLRKSRPLATVELSVDVDPEHDAARITLGGETLILNAGEWSDWVTVRYDLMPPFVNVSGICRFYLRSVRPHLGLYVTPVNIDPQRPALPLSTPPSFVRELQDRIGPFYTQGMPEDTKALERGVFSDPDFVSQVGIVMDERWRMLDAALDDYRDGFLFFYVSSLDQSSHVLWRNVDETHPAHADSLQFGDWFEHVYGEMDSLLGVVRARIPNDATLIVMSDHGFAPIYKKFHLNTWLRDEGYLTLSGEGEAQALFANVQWRRSRAYALGLNGLYVNLLGREAKGIVRRGAEYEALLDEISAKLLALTDSETGDSIITRVYRPDEAYSSVTAESAPDLIVGYNRGYRGSDESALGRLTDAPLTVNLGKWTGGHCMDHTLVPGVLVSNARMGLERARLIDLPVTILKLYGIEAPAQMRGQPLIDD